jgi:hypothetical protein
MMKMSSNAKTLAIAFAEGNRISLLRGDLDFITTVSCETIAARD